MHSLRPAEPVSQILRRLPSGLMVLDLGFQIRGVDPKRSTSGY